MQQSRAHAQSPAYSSRLCVLHTSYDPLCIRLIRRLRMHRTCHQTTIQTTVPPHCAMQPDRQGKRERERERERERKSERPHREQARGREKRETNGGERSILHEIQTANIQACSSRLTLMRSVLHSLAHHPSHSLGLSCSSPSLTSTLPPRAHCKVLRQLTRAQGTRRAACAHSLTFALI